MNNLIFLSLRSGIAKQVMLSVLLLFFVFDGVSASFFTKKVTAVPMIRLKMYGTANYLDETVLYYQAGATGGFDSGYDAYKLTGPNPAPYISQQYNSVLMAINGIAPVVQSFSIHIKTTTHITGSFTITAEDFSDLPAGTCVSLRDLTTETSVNILEGPYIFILPDTTSAPRFILFITGVSLPLASQLTQPTCQAPGGKIKVQATGTAPWQYVWKDAGGLTVKTTFNSSGSDSLINLSGGNYTVEVSSVNNACLHQDTSFSIAHLILPAVSFTSPDTVIAGGPQNYAPINQSANCSISYWNFGDGTGADYSFTAQHTYSVPGVYKTMLVGISSSGCVDSAKKYVRVISLATHIRMQDSQSFSLTGMGENQFKMQASQGIRGDIDVRLVALDGQTLLTQQLFLDSEAGITIDLGNFKAGIYALTIGYAGREVLCSKIVIK